MEQLPQIIIFSSGEQTPFSIELTPGWDTEPWLIESAELMEQDASSGDGTEDSGSPDGDSDGPE